MNNISLIKTIEEDKEIMQLISIENETKKEYCKTPLSFMETLNR
jgi:hypothetical protein